MGLGVRPDVSLARDAGIAIGARGGVSVNEFLQTSAPHVWAIGDAIEVENFVTGRQDLIALAGPANRQGRLVADNILLPSMKPYAGTVGTAIVRVFSKIAACTGVNERTARELDIPFKKIYLFPASHAGYFPGAKSIAMKVLFDPHTRKLLGAQAVGEDGVDKRIDILATALKGGLTIDDVADLELCYAPPFGSAKDPVNMAGMMAQNIADGLVDMVGPEEIGDFALDVRSAAEVAQGSIPGALHIPLDELRSRLNELPKDRKIYVYCQSGQRSYNATRILLQHGFDAVNVTGAYRAYGLLV
jgi:rhodanese-related sulfurtransferase